MYGITPEGYVTKPLATIREGVDDSQRANIDPGLDLDDRSAQGQVNAITSAALSELWELGQAIYSAAYPDSANDASLDNVASITGTSRSATTKTLVEGVLVTLNPNAPLPIGSVARLASQPNARFVSLAAVAADPLGGIFPVDFEAETAGATSVVIGQLDTIAEPVTGWVGVTNPAAGVTGEETETDPALRVKRLAELEGGGSTNVDSIRANLLRDVAGVVDAAVSENDSEVFDSNGVPPHAIYCVLRGGGSVAVAQSIFDTKAGGINTHGVQTETILDSQGIGHDINFDYAAELVYYLDALLLSVDPLVFDASTGLLAAKTAVAAYVNGLAVGGDVIADQIKCAILSVPGVLSTGAFDHGFSASPTGEGDLPVALTQYATADLLNLNIAVGP